MREFVNSHMRRAPIRPPSGNRIASPPKPRRLKGGLSFSILSCPFGQTTIDIFEQSCLRRLKRTQNELPVWGTITVLFKPSRFYFYHRSRNTLLKYHLAIPIFPFYIHTGSVQQPRKGRRERKIRRSAKQEGT